MTIVSLAAADVGEANLALRDLFTGPRAKPIPVHPELAAALANLGRLSAARPELVDAGAALARVLNAVFLDPIPDPEPYADPDLIRQGWAAGIPAFRVGDDPPMIAPDPLRRRAAAVCDALGVSSGPGVALRQCVLLGKADLHAWALEWLQGGSDAFNSDAERLGLAPDVVRSVLRLALLPALAAHSRRLDPLRVEGVWTSGFCPNCGSPPSLAESLGLERRRVYRCGICASGWDGDRLRCPYCDEADHRRLGYRFIDGEEDRARLAYCETCEGTLRVVSVLTPHSAPGLVVAELATAYLDGLDRETEP